MGLTWACLINGKTKLKLSEFTSDGEFIGELSKYQLLKTGFYCTGAVQLSPYALYRYVHLQNTNKLCSSSFLCP